MINGKQIKKVAIVLRPKNHSDFESIIPTLVKWLTRRKKSVFFLITEKDRVEKFVKSNAKLIEYIDFKDLAKIDLIISLGGDGTLIGLSRRAKSTFPPIFGANLGKLGFVTEFSKVELFEELEHLLTKGKELMSVNLYCAEIFSKGKSVSKSFFVNDAVLSKNDLSRMFTLSLDINDEHVYKLSGDGLIVSSPLGSTAYSLAAGGPIIHPLVSSMVLTPVCPHSLTHRPIVIPNTSKVMIQNLETNENIMLTLDGQEGISIGPKMKVLISRSKTKNIKLVKNNNKAFFHTLKEKLTHGRRN